MKITIDGRDSFSAPIDLTVSAVGGSVIFTADAETGDITSSTSDMTITGTAELFAPNLKIYPNPFTGTVRIADTNGCTLRITNAAGVLVHIRPITGKDETVNLEYLPTGVYFFTIENGKQAKTVKIIKN